MCCPLRLARYLLLLLPRKTPPGRSRKLTFSLLSEAIESKLKAVSHVKGRVREAAVLHKSFASKPLGMGYTNYRTLKFGSAAGARFVIRRRRRCSRFVSAS